MPTAFKVFPKIKLVLARSTCYFVWQIKQSLFPILTSLLFWYFVLGFEVSLVNGPYPNQGTVQVMFDGFKGAICHYDWDESEGEVICRQLGYQSLVVAIPGWDAKDLYSYAEEDFLIRDLECEGTEGNLADCYYRIPDDGICSGFSGNQAAVVCYSDEYPSVDPRPTESKTKLCNRFLLW